MDEKRIDVRSWQVGLAGLLVGAVVFAAILALWRPWEKLPPIGEVRGNILDADIKQIQKLTSQLTKDPIQSMEVQENGAIEVTIERTLEFFTFELVGGKWEKTSSGYIATSMGPAGGFAPVPAPAPPNTLPVGHATLVDSIQYYPAAPLEKSRPLTPAEDALIKKAIDESSLPPAPSITKDYIRAVIGPRRPVLPPDNPNSGPPPEPPAPGER